jgi:hypothetical protein
VSPSAITCSTHTHAHTQPSPAVMSECVGELVKSVACMYVCVCVCVCVFVCVEVFTVAFPHSLTPSLPHSLTHMVHKPHALLHIALVVHAKHVQRYLPHLPLLHTHTQTYVTRSVHSLTHTLTHQYHLLHYGQVGTGLRAAHSAPSPSTVSVARRHHSTTQ